VSRQQYKLRAEEFCPSTHGGSGYALGSFWEDSNIICGLCGMRIENPAPTGGRFVLRKGLWNHILNRSDWIPTWPDWIRQV
jgi:hypothetical protein